MNIFCYSSDPYTCALWLDDKRHNKMILETAQLLSTTVRWIADYDEEPDVYKRAYYNHPCARWVRESRYNMLWLVDYMQLLVDMKHGLHKSALLLPTFRQYLNHPNWSAYASEQTPFVNCARNQSLGLDFTSEPDVHQAYRLYHRARWALDDPKPTWRWGHQPKWSGLDATT